MVVGEYWHRTSTSLKREFCSEYTIALTQKRDSRSLMLHLLDINYGRQILLNATKSSFLSLLVGIGLLTGCQSSIEYSVENKDALVFEGHTVKEICDAERKGEKSFGSYPRSEPMSTSNIKRALQQRGYPSGTCTDYYKEQQLKGSARGQAICERMLDANSLSDSQRLLQMDTCMTQLGWK